MQKRLTLLIKRHAWWISLLLHLFFIVNFSFVWMQPDTIEPQPSLEISSYVYHEPKASAISPMAQQQTAKEQPKPRDKNGIEKPSQEQTNTMSLTAPRQSMQSKYFDNAKTKPTDEEPVHLIGNSDIVKPLIKILGKALTAHLVYPKIAVDFGLRGTVHIGFLLSPNGQVSNAKVVKSSGAGVLDDAALKAVNAMSPINGVTPYLPEAKFLVVGVIFG